MIDPVKLRLPTAAEAPTSDFTPPSPEWLNGTWHVTHSTLPLWKNKRNVTLTYAPLPPAASGASRIDDIASYQTLSSPKIHTVHGIDTSSGASSGGWNWRGKGWLRIASSHWEILGYGDLEGGGQWAVSYFAKTLFTPAGIDILSRRKEGVEDEVVEAVKKALGELQHKDVKKLAGGLFEVTRN